MSNPDHSTEKMNEYRELREYVRQLRENILEMDDLVDEMQWVAAGGRGAPDRERLERLAKANRRMCEDLDEEIVPEAPDPWEERENE